MPAFDPKAKVLLGKPPFPRYSEIPLSFRNHGGWLEWWLTAEYLRRTGEERRRL